MVAWTYLVVQGMHVTSTGVNPCSQFRTEAALITHGFLNVAHVFASRQHALARTAGCDRGLNK